MATLLLRAGHACVWAWGLVTEVAAGCNSTELLVGTIALYRAQGGRMPHVQDLACASGQATRWWAQGDILPSVGYCTKL
jgi:hypothetical protein